MFSLAIQHQDCPVPRNIVALNPGKEMVLRALLPGCAPTQILETVSKILDTMLCSGHLTPRSGSQFHQGHLYFGVESGESREGRLVSSKEENQFNGGVEVGFGPTVTGVLSSSSSMHFVVCCTFLALVPNLQGSLAGVMVSEVTGPPQVTDVWKEQVIPSVNVTGTDLSLWRQLRFLDSCILDQEHMASDRNSDMKGKRKGLLRTEVG